MQIDFSLSFENQILFSFREKKKKKLWILRENKFYDGPRFEPEKV